MLGIDIGAYSVKAAVIKRSGKKVVIEQFSSEPFPPEKRGGTADHETIRVLVTKAIKKVGKGQTVVALSVPTSSAILKTVPIDSTVGDEMLQGEIQLELVNFVPFPIDQVYADFKRIGVSDDDPDKDDIFVAVSRKDIVDRIADSVEVRTIKEKQVDVEAFAMGQVVEHVCGRNQNAYAVVDIGYKTSSFCVYQNGDMLFSREQQVGGHNLTEAIAEANGIETEEAEKLKLKSLSNVAPAIVEGYLDSVNEQIALALEFFGSTSDVVLDSVYLTGGGSMVSGLVESLSSGVPNCNFDILPIGKDIRIGKKTHGMSVESVIATSAISVGLSMRS